MKESNPFQHLQLFTSAVLQPLWDIILGKSALISNQRRIILWWGKTTLSLKVRGTIDQKNSPVFYNAYMQTLEEHWNTHMGSVLSSILCLTVSMSRLKTLRHAFSFAHTFLGLVLLTSYISKSLRESSTWRFGCRIHGPWYQSWLLPRQDALNTSSPRICSSMTSSAPLPQPWHWARPYSSLSKFLSPAEKYRFVCCGVSELNDSLHVSQQVLELLSGAGQGGRALHTLGSRDPLHQPGLRWQITAPEQPKPIWPPVSHPLPPTAFRTFPDSFQMLK